MIATRSSCACPVCGLCAEPRFLDERQAYAEAEAARHGPLRGPVRAAQLVWSWTLDMIAAEREAA